MAKNEECKNCHRFYHPSVLTHGICTECEPKSDLSKTQTTVNVVRLKTHNIEVRDKDGVPIKGDYIELLIPGKPMPKELREMLLAQLGGELGEVALMKLHKLSVMAALGEML